MLVPWAALRPSLRARRWRTAGYAIAVAACVLLFSSAFASEPFDAGRLILACCVAVFCWLAAREPPRKSLEIGVSGSGELKLRERHPTIDALTSDDAPDLLPLRVSFAAPWLISLRRGTMLVPIWPDCLPPTVYRQLWVHLHWGRAALRDDDQKTTTARDKFMAR